MSLLRVLRREPLVHFLLGAVALFVLHAFWQGFDGGSNERRIVVDRPALLRYLQYRAQTFEPDTFEARLDALTVTERQQLIDEYVREEALYREALALGLEREDNVLRLRLVQKMAFLLEPPPAAEPSEAELQAYYAAHSREYEAAPSWTFTHVFLDAATRGDAGARQTALTLLKQLNAARAQFNDAPLHGDRFAYLQNYVERTPDFIEAHFGADFQAALATLPAGDARWQGPLRSSLGWHLVLVTAYGAGGMPAFSDVRAQVLDAHQRERAMAARQQAERELVGRYQVVIGGFERGQQP
jgi:hypothetical protein